MGLLIGGFSSGTTERRPAGLWPLVLLAFFAALIPAMELSAQPRVQRPEYEVKAAFLFNFARFIDWPEYAFSDDESAFKIGVLGIDPFGPALDDALEGRTIDGRTIEVVRSESLKNLLGVHILFVSQSERFRIVQHLEALAGEPILTVSDTEGFARRGGMVELYLQDRRVAFRINPVPADENNLRISSRLLNLARIEGSR